MKITDFALLYSNVSNILPKLEELKTIVGNTKAAVISITQSKIDNSVSNAEIGIPCYCILRDDRNRYRGTVACYVGENLCFNLRNIFTWSF